MIKHDISDRSVVTLCTDCPYWRAFSFDLDEARRRGANHLIQVHEVEPYIAERPILRAATRRQRREVAQKRS